MAKDSSQPTLELLEDRTLMAFGAELTATGILQVTSTDDVDILLTTTGAPKEVMINGAAPVRQSGTGPVLASEVTGIVVSDGDFANRIDLNAVNSVDFTSLNPTVVIISINTAGGNDTIVGTAFKDSIISGLGNDWIVPTASGDTIMTGEGDDTIAIESTLVGATNGDYFIDLGSGNDRVAIPRPDGGEGDATIYGGEGNDSIDGGEGVDRIYGGDGDDVLTTSGYGFSILFGQAGNDRLENKGTGRSMLLGGTGSDSLTSGQGADILIDAPYVYENASLVLMNLVSQEWTGPRIPTSAPNGNKFDSPPTDVAIRRLTNILTTGNNQSPPLFILPSFIIEDNAPDTIQSAFGNDWVLRGITQPSAIATTILGGEYGTWVDTIRNNVNPTRDDFVVPISQTSTSIAASELLSNDTDDVLDTPVIVEASLDTSESDPQASVSFTFLGTSVTTLSSATINWGNATGKVLFRYRPNVIEASSLGTTSWVPVTITRANTVEQTVTGDFDGDGLIDALRIDADSLDIARHTQTSFQTWAPLDATITWLDPMVGDFTGDGQDDLLMRHGLDRHWYIWSTFGGNIVIRQQWAPWRRSNDWSKPLVGDFDNDGKDDLFSFRQQNADLVIARSTGFGFEEQIWNNIRERIGNAYGSIPTEIAFDIGQLDGQGGEDVLVHDPRDNGDWAFVLAEGYRFTNLSIPVSFPGWSSTYYVGNFDNDSADEIVAWNATVNNSRWDIAEVVNTTIQTKPSLGNAHANRSDFIIQDIDWDGDQDFVTKPAGTGSPSWRVLRTDANELTPIDSATWDAWLDASSFVAGGKRVVNEVNPITNLRLKAGAEKTIIQGDIPTGFTISHSNPSLSLLIEFDTNGDGVVDGWSRPDSTTRTFEFQPYALPAGSNSIRARIAFSSANERTRVSPWTAPFTFDVAPKPDQLPIPRLLGLVGDIGGQAGDQVAGDRKVRTATISHRVEPGSFNINQLRMEFDHNGDGIPDGTAPATSSPSNYVPVNLGSGTHSVRARTRLIGSDSQVSEWSSPLTFSISAKLDVTYRDFINRGGTPPSGTGTTNLHPHFEADISGVSPHSGIFREMVGSTLGLDRKPTYKPGAIRDYDNYNVPNPLDFEPNRNSQGGFDTLSPSNNEFPRTPAQYFADWFTDNPTFNQRIEDSLWFEEKVIGSGEFSYADGDFFPLTGRGFGNQNQGKNYAFTMELHATFTYREGQTLGSAGSDDDLWVFINNRLVVDLGGIHGPANSKRPIETLGLVDGQTYPIDIFFAERHTSLSNLQLLLGLENLRSISSTSPLLIEEHRFLTESSTIGQYIPISLNSNTQAISFDIDSLSFDTTDPASINDALELVLVNNRGESVVPTIGLGRQAFFNATEGRPIEQGAGVAWVPDANVAGKGRIYVDVRQVPANDKIFLSARLINNDGLKQIGPDITTQARLLASTLQQHTTLPSNVTWASEKGFQAPPRASGEILDLSPLTTITRHVSLEYTGTSFDDVAHRLFVGVDLSFVGTQIVRGDYPLLLVVRDISDPSIRLDGSHGLTPEGDPYYDLSSLIFSSDTDNWIPGDPVTKGELRFLNPERRRFTYTIDFLGRVNERPVITPPPSLIEWYSTANNSFSYRFSASDPENDALTFSAISLPSSMSLNSQTGEVRWDGTPVPGSYLVDVEATDSRGAKSDPARFVLSIMASDNRPPRFVTLPEEFARAGRDFVYEPRAVDPDGDAVTIAPLSLAPLSLPPRASFDSVNRRVVWRPTKEEIGQSFPIWLKATDGRGGEEIQKATIKVVADPLNGPPIILTEPSPTHAIPSSAIGTAMGNVTPPSINLTLANGSESLHHPVSVTLNTGLTNSVDVVFIVDRSPSMKDQHEWLIGTSTRVGMVELLEQKLAALNITSNRYGFVAYGRDSSILGVTPIKWAVDRLPPDDSNSFVDTGDVRSFLFPGGVGTFPVDAALGDDSPENAYDAIRLALDENLESLSNFAFRPGVGRNYILITNEDADDMTPQLQNELATDLVQNGINFSAIISDELNANDGNGNTGNFAAQTAGWSTTQDAWVGISTPATGEQLSLGLWDRHPPVPFSSEGGQAGWVDGLPTFEVEFNVTESDSAARFRFYFGYSDQDNYRFVEADYQSSTWKVGWRRKDPFTNLVSSAERELDFAYLPPLITGETHRIGVARRQLDYFGANNYFTSDDTISIDGKWIADEFLMLCPPPSSVSNANVVNKGAFGFGILNGTVSLYEVRAGWVRKDVYSRPGDLYLSVWRQQFGTNGSRPVDGITAEGTAFLSAANGTTSVLSAGKPIADDSFPLIARDAGVSHFWPIVQATGGSLWNFEAISKLTSDGQIKSTSPPIQGNFSATFAEVQSREIYESTRPELVPTDPSVVKRIQLLDPSSSTSATASYLVDFVGDGRSRELALQFVSQFTYTGNKRFPNQATGIVGQIPVKINAPYSHQFRAIDPDGDRPLVFRWTDNADHHGATITPEGLFSWNPPYSSGTYSFSVTVEDGAGGSDTKSWKITLTPPSSNAAPQFQVPTPINGSASLPLARQGAEYEFNFKATDPNGDRVRYYFVGEPPAGGELDAESGRFRWRPTNTGSVGFQVSAEDGRGGQTILTASLVVADRQAGNAAPIITSQTPFPLAVVGENYRDRVVASDSNNDAVRYFLSTGPRGMAIDADTGEIAWRPIDSQVGVHDVVILAQDARGMSTVLPFAVRVYAVNQAPTFDSIPRLKGTPGAALRFPLTTFDPDGDRVIFEFDPNKGNSFPVTVPPTVSTNNEFEWNVPTGQSAGTYAFDLYARDRRGGSAKQTVLVDIASSGTMTPSVAPRVTKYLVERENWSYQVVPAAPNRTIEVDEFGSFFGISASGTSLVWSVVGYGVMPPFMVSIRDNGELVARQEVRLIIAKDGLASSKPVITYGQIGPMVADVPFRSKPIAYSPNGSPISYQAVTPLPPGMTLDTATGELNWTPTRAQAGRHTLQIRATAGIAQQDVTLYVISLANAPPQLPLTVLPTLVAGSATWSQPLAGIDPNGVDQSGLVYQLSRGPAGMSVTSGQLHFTPTTPGLYPFEIEVKDAFGSRGFWRSELRVIAAGANNNPIIDARPAARVLAGLTYRSVITATDADQDAVTFRKVSGPISLFVSPTGLVEWSTTGSDVASNTNTFEVEAIDARGGASRRVFGIDVYNGGIDNQAPVITNNPPKSFVFGDTYVYQPIAVDPENDLLSWSLMLGPDGAEFDPTTGEFRWTPQTLEVTRVKVVIRVSDHFNGSFERGFVVEVNTSNLPPIRLDDPPGHVIAGEFKKFPMRFEDPEGDPLNYTLAMVTPSGPSWLTYDEEDGELAGIAPATPGNYDFMMTVSDGPNVATFPFRINVRTNSTPRPPVIGNLDPPTHAVPGQTFVFNPQASDPNNDTLLFTSTLPTGQTTFPGGVLHWAVPANQPPGPISFTLSIDDQTGYKFDIPLRVTIVPSNAPPVISPELQSFRRVLGTELRADLRSFVSDPDPGDIPRLSMSLISVSGLPSNFAQPVLRPTDELVWSKENDSSGVPHIGSPQQIGPEQRRLATSRFTPIAIPNLPRRRWCREIPSSRLIPVRRY